MKGEPRSLKATQRPKTTDTDAFDQKRDDKGQRHVTDEELRRKLYGASRPDASKAHE